MTTHLSMTMGLPALSWDIIWLSTMGWPTGFSHQEKELYPAWYADAEQENEISTHRTDRAAHVQLT